MGFMDKVRAAMTRFMTGRYGSDHLGMATLMAGVVLYILSMIFGSGILSLISFVLYGVTLFRMLSRNIEARRLENQKYLQGTEKWRLEATRFIRRQKNRKEYKYFRCPKCRQLLRLKRGCGEKEVTCAKCGHTFTTKA